MKIVAAYLLAVLGGNTNPSAGDLKNILSSGTRSLSSFLRLDFHGFACCDNVCKGSILIVSELIDGSIARKLWAVAIFNWVCGEEIHTLGWNESLAYIRRTIDL